MTKHIDRSYADQYALVVARDLAQSNRGKLPFKTYAEYLLSPYWSRIRARVIGRANGRCSCCDAIADQVHHRSYSIAVIAGRDLGQLVAICDSCHRQAERPNGHDQMKATTAQANEWIDGRIAKKQDQKRKDATARRVDVGAETLICKSCSQLRRPRDFAPGSGICKACDNADDGR